MNDAVDATRRAGDARARRSPGGRRRSRCRPSRPADRGRRPAPAAARAIARRASSRGARRSSSSSRSARAGRVAGGRRRRQQDLALALPFVASNRLSSSAIEPARITLSSGRRAATAATRLATSSRARRSSGPGGSPAPRRTASTVGSRSIDVIVSGSAVWGLADDDAASRSGGRPRRAGATARSDAAIAARRCGRALWATRRGRSLAAPARSMPSVRASSGSPAAVRVSRRRTRASISTPAGMASAPIRRQRWRTRATRAADEVAAPRSRARKALGSLVTASCYPDSTGISGDPRSLAVGPPAGPTGGRGHR